MHNNTQNPEDTCTENEKGISKHTEKTTQELLEQPTMSIQEAGVNFFNLSVSTSYLAAKRGDIPTIKIGGQYVVPTARLAKMLGLKANIGGRDYE